MAKFLTIIKATQSYPVRHSFLKRELCEVNAWSKFSKLIKNISMNCKLDIVL